ncbi:GNAT family N-acetyltransferase [Streptomyces avermitilis]|uniref:GNAT family N-acetyltransferase n=1 Tax=Streptomyces avermitilis TaxID=33903 RepID=UPI00381EFBC4
MTNANIIGAKRLILREALVGEAEQILAGEQVEGQRWAEGYPFGGTIGGAKLLMRSVEAGTHRSGFGMYQITEQASGLVIGDIGCHSGVGSDRAVEIGYGIVEAWRRRGYTTEAVRALSAWLLAQPGVDEVRAETEEDHAASRGVLRNGGFRHVGTEGGTVLYRLRSEDLVEPVRNEER